jgi:molecular chaperone DnaK (HSP70)
MNARFSLGIDLGTSNSAIAVGDIESGDSLDDDQLDAAPARGGVVKGNPQK